MVKRYVAGRLNTPTDAFVKEFGASVLFDKRLAPYDIKGSIAHATMLAKVGILTKDECAQITRGLQKIDLQIETNNFDWSIDLEDVHMNIEHALVTQIGEVGKKLHTGRSRNDQVATDIRLWLRDEIRYIQFEIKRLMDGLVALAEQEIYTIMPGFTHLQVAQPISFAHHMLAWFEMLQRDHERFDDCYHRTNIMPLGAAALAGTTFSIDRELTKELLGFEHICKNSLDAVSDRDFAIEFCASSAILMTHLSRFSEEIILWCSAQFNFVSLSDAFCTGSSIMPQKKNPDVPELVRGKTGRVNGHLINLLTLMKAQPLAYNKDNQEDKEPLFDTADTLKNCLRIYADMIPAIKTHPDITRSAAIQGYATATDLADYLVRAGVAFRDAHHVVGKAVAFGIEKGLDLSDFSLDELRQFSHKIKSDVFDVLTLEGSIKTRDHLGGTSFNQIKQTIERIKSHD